MSFYPFLVAQLPLLFFDSRAPVSMQALARYAAEWLPAEEGDTLLRLAAGEWPDHPVIRDYRQFDVGLRNQLALLRGTRMNRDPEPYLLGSERPDHVTRQVLADCLKDENREHAERMIDSLRWKFIEDRTVMDNFNFTFLVAYFLKLRILERWSLLDEQRGLELLQAALEERPKDPVGTPS